MNSTSIFILPGLDGTELLLQRFLDLAPSHISVKILPLPDDPNADYESMVAQLSAMIATGPCHIIAESFSGPIGILLARRYPAIVTRLTLVASFASTPTPFFARYMPWSMLFRFPMPGLVAKRYFIGSENSLLQTLQTAIRSTSVPTLVKRIHCVINANVTDELSGIDCPIDYVRPSNDRLIPDWNFRNILMINPNIYVMPVDGPHLIMQTRPRETWDAIIGRTCEQPE